MIDRTRIKELILKQDPAFWEELRLLTASATEFEEIFFLSNIRKKAAARGMSDPSRRPRSLRLAVLGGSSLYPLHELISHFLEVRGTGLDLFVGEYDNYVSEVSSIDGVLYRFRPEIVILLPGLQRTRYGGTLADPRQQVQASADAVVAHLLELTNTLHERLSAEIVLGNFPLPGRRDPGPLRSRTLASDWSYRKWINLELGLKAPPYVRICDLEFLSNRRGALESEDARAWFESKQPGSPALLVDIAREASRLISSIREPSKKVLVLDLDNTLWGGVVADDGVDGIEIGDTSPRGEAFKAFQRYVAQLKGRGVLLAVCSKNDLKLAMEPFDKHPDMVLKLSDFVRFVANWEPKSDNIRQMATELNLGLDSFVFVDDNPAEIEIVRQFAPDVATVLLGADPSYHVGLLQDCGFFEAHQITNEDLQRTEQYRAESQRRTLLASAVDMDSYLETLEMEATIREFNELDRPRLTQLINKSNQFNLTTRRKTEAEVDALIASDKHICFSIRLADRFGDHGLISVVIGNVMADVIEIDTWIMSCRVLKRQVEEVALNELARLAIGMGCKRLNGLYLPTAKNAMVEGFYSNMGFKTVNQTSERSEFSLDLDTFHPRLTKVRVIRHAYGPS